MKGNARYGISDDLGRLTFAHPGDLAFLEIGIDPQAVSRHDGQELGANRRIGADARTAIADDPVDRRADFRVAQIEARQIAISIGLIEVSRSLFTLCIDDLELALGSFKGRLRLAFASARFLVVGVGLLEPLPRSKPVVAQRSVAIDVIFGAHPLSHCCRELSPGLVEHRHPHAPRGVHIDETRPPCGNVCLSAGELRPIIAVVELEQQVASLDGLVIDNRDNPDETRDLERQRRDLAPDIGVVGRFDVLPDHHPVPHETRGGTNEDGAGGE
jgi:hypothetical protein